MRSVGGEKREPPDKEAIQEFLKNRPNVQVSNRHFNVNGVAFFTQSATTRIRISGTLYITTNAVVILADERDPPEVYQ